MTGAATYPSSLDATAQSLISQVQRKYETVGSIAEFFTAAFGCGRKSEAERSGKDQVSPVLPRNGLGQVVQKRNFSPGRQQFEAGLKLSHIINQPTANQPPEDTLSYFESNQEDQATNFQEVNPIFDGFVFNVEDTQEEYSPLLDEDYSEYRR